MHKEVPGRVLVITLDRPARRNAIDRARTPLIAAVEGFPLGGGMEIAMACDLVVAAPDARFGLPEVTIGLLRTCGGPFRGPRALPVNVARELVLTGDSIEAARNFCLISGGVMSSSVDSHTDPHHTPAAPSASAAAICRPLAIPPAARTGRPSARSTISRVSTVVAMVPVCPPASVPWAISTSTRSELTDGVLRLPDERGHHHTLLLGPLDHVRRRSPERVRDECDRVRERHVEQGRGSAGRCSRA